MRSYPEHVIFIFCHNFDLENFLKKSEHFFSSKMKFFRNLQKKLDPFGPLAKFYGGGGGGGGGGDGPPAPPPLPTPLEVEQVVLRHVVLEEVVLWYIMVIGQNKV